MRRHWQKSRHTDIPRACGTFGRGAHSSTIITSIASLSVQMAMSLLSGSSKPRDGRPHRPGVTPENLDRPLGFCESVVSWHLQLTGKSRALQLISLIDHAVMCNFNILLRMVLSLLTLVHQALSGLRRFRLANQSASAPSHRLLLAFTGYGDFTYGNR